MMMDLGDADTEPRERRRSQAAGDNDVMNKEALLQHPIVVAALLAAISAGVTIWREQPVSAVQVSQVVGEVSALRTDVNALQRSHIALESESRASKAQLDNLKEGMAEIKRYNATISKELQSINVQLAEIRGESKKKGGNK